MNKITSQEIDLLAAYIFKISGIHLGQDKGYLLESRLLPLMEDCNCASYSELCQLAKKDGSGELEKEFIEAISTNETFFFRDTVPFDLLRNKIVPELIDRRKNRIPAGSKIPIRIWSAACSTGQEVYSIAMTLLDMLDPGLFEISILGTDISNKVVSKASYGLYNRFEIQRGLPIHYRNRYFRQIGDGWRIKDEVRLSANFKKINLMQPFPSFICKFDIIFCRNVAIYFNQADQVKLFRKLGQSLDSDGAFIVGGSESLAGIAPDFEAMHYQRGIYYQLKNRHQGHSPVKQQNKNLTRPSSVSSPPEKSAAITPTLAVHAHSATTSVQKKSGRHRPSPIGTSPSIKQRGVTAKPVSPAGQSAGTPSLQKEIKSKQNKEKQSLLSGLIRQSIAPSSFLSKNNAAQQSGKATLLDSIATRIEQKKQKKHGEE